MRGLAIEQSFVYIAPKLPGRPILDENGFDTGEVETIYDTPLSYSLNVKDITDEADLNMFGLSARSMKRIDATDYDLEGYIPKIGDMFWVDFPVGANRDDGNYVVERVVKSTNSYRIYLKSRRKLNITKTEIHE